MRLFSRTIILAIIAGLLAPIALPYAGLVADAQFAHAQIAQLSAEDQARLQAELVQVEKEQKEAEQTLAGAQKQSASLSRDILILTTKIKAAQLNIKAKNLLIQSLGRDITTKEQTITTLEDRIDHGKESLAQIMRKTRELDAYNIPVILLSQQTLSGALTDIDTFESVQLSLKTTFENIRSAKSQTESEKNALDKRRIQEMDARAAIQQEQKNIERDQAERQQLLAASKSTEKTYTQILAEKRKKAAEIRAALFALRDSKAIPFEDALAYATLASKQTGIRPAFLLAILTQESALGKNVGSCYLTNQASGEGVSSKSGTVYPNVMKPGRDVGPFVEITGALGLDPSKTLVSCPQSVGWGGAMGPAQFIASTWMLFKNRIATATGSSYPNPWNPRDAFMASAIYLTDLGALGSSYTGEQNAACKYYSGSSCSKSSLIRSYGTSVMSHADTIQRTMIDPLQGI
ncbi:MAG: hypothetical protein JWO73_194 [Candidatus Taylorbacteria bacterium]|nr:hypothetical protein [Candidatus Taylorbacteria bacterium]